MGYSLIRFHNGRLTLWQLQAEPSLGSLDLKATQCLKVLEVLDMLEVGHLNTPCVFYYSIYTCYW